MKGIFSLVLPNGHREICEDEVIYPYVPIDKIYNLTAKADSFWSNCLFEVIYMKCT